MVVRFFIMISALGLSACGAADANGPLQSDGSADQAAAAAPSQILFECDLGGKSVRVTAAGDRLTYRYGTGDEAEMTLTEAATGGNLFYMAQRYAGMQYQLRFADGDTSYIVFSAEGNAHVGANATSGLVVMRGAERVLDESCASYSEFSADFDYSTLPQDGETYSAM